MRISESNNFVRFRLRNPFFQRITTPQPALQRISGSHLIMVNSYNFRENSVFAVDSGRRWELVVKQVADSVKAVA